MAGQADLRRDVAGTLRAKRLDVRDERFALRVVRRGLGVPAGRRPDREGGPAGQSGQITDKAVAAELTGALQLIGTLLDAGDKTTASSLLAAFQEVVRGLNRRVITASAANQLTGSAKTIAAGL